MSMRVSGTILPALLHSSRVAEPLTMTSNGSPALARCANAGGRSLVRLRRYPVVRSNSGPISASTVAIALAVHTLSSAGDCAAGSLGADAMRAMRTIRCTTRMFPHSRGRSRTR